MLPKGRPAAALIRLLVTWSLTAGKDQGARVEVHLPTTQPRCKWYGWRKGVGPG
jgi:hypothetical protein